MPRRTSVLIAAVTAATAMFSTAVSWAETPTTMPSAASQQAQIDRLQAELDQLKIAQHQSAPQTADTTAASVVQDADGRSDPLHFMDTDGAITAGHEPGRFFIRSADGNYVLHPWIQIQPRNTTEYRQEGKANGDDDTENGWELSRLRVGADGTVITPDLFYSIILNFGRTTGSPTLQDAYVKYRFHDTPWYVRTGQYRGPVAHEGMVGSRRLLGTDRTFLDNVLAGNDNFIDGAEVAYDIPTKPWRAEFSVDSGFNRNNSNFQNYSSNATGKADWGVAGRLEYKVTGNWADYEDFTALNCKKTMLIVGGGVDETQIGDTNQVIHTVDATYKGPNGLGAYVSYLGRYEGNNQGPYTFNSLPTQTSKMVNDTYDWGVLVQANYLFQPKWEVFGRYDYVNFDSKSLAATLTHDVHEISVGSNYYFDGQNAKATLELIYQPNGSPVTDTGEDLIANNQAIILVKAQFQLII